MRHRSAWLVSTVLFVEPLSTTISAQESATSSLVEFATSCHPAIAAEFNYAVEMLHSFEYPESERIFRSILDAAPDCGMARWGIAMNQWTPLWVPPSRAALETGAAMLAEINRSSLTRREEGFVDALSVFFDDFESLPHIERAQRYRDHMETVYSNNLDDPEAAVFYALSLLASAAPTDKTYANQFKSGALLNWVRETQPLHPGMLHYTIHSYDYPGMAHLALEAATIYAGAAPDSAHAQHMPSHIFTRLGMWDRSISSNYDSTASAAAYTLHANLPGHYDEGLHSIDYLMYALLQAARDQDALEVLDRLGAIGMANNENFKVAYTYASSPGRYALERRQWAEATEIELWPGDFPWDGFGWARSIHHFARGLGAARSDQLELAREELATIEGLRAALPVEISPYFREEVFVHADVIASWIALAEGDTATALQLARSAADREDAVDKHPVTPSEILPARELLGDMLLDLDRPADALAEYRLALAVSPKRTNALLGAARAAARSRETVAALSYYQTVLDQTASGNPDRVGLNEARDYVAANQ